MLKVFEEVRKNVSFKSKVVHIDSPLSRLHYAVTFGLLLICCVLVCSQQYIGEHIRCIADKGVNEKVMETFCFFTSTFTLVRRSNDTAHPGVGPMSDDEPVVHHGYYQWVPFILFGQALLFRLPRSIWKRLEGGTVKAMVNGFEYLALASRDSPTKVDKVTVPSVKERAQKLEAVRTAFLDRLYYHRNWAKGLVFCEMLNLVNVVLQIVLMHHFLGGHFMNMFDADMMDIVFPKVTKCTFHKYGPSGSIQRHDALCVMALNVINEKIYFVLWYWFLFLFCATSLGLLYRLASLLFYSTSPAFNRLTFNMSSPVTLDPISLQRVTERCGYSGWLLLHYLAMSMDGFVFRELLRGLALKLDKCSPAPTLDELGSSEEVPLKSRDAEVFKDE